MSSKIRACTIRPSVSFCGAHHLGSSLSALLFGVFFARYGYGRQKRQNNDIDMTVSSRKSINDESLFEYPEKAERKDTPQDSDCKRVGK